MRLSRSLVILDHRTNHDVQEEGRQTERDEDDHEATKPLDGDVDTISAENLVIGTQHAKRRCYSFADEGGERDNADRWVALHRPRPPATPLSTKTKGPNNAEDLAGGAHKEYTEERVRNNVYLRLQRISVGLAVINVDYEYEESDDAGQPDDSQQPPDRSFSSSQCLSIRL